MKRDFFIVAFLLTGKVCSQSIELEPTVVTADREVEQYEGANGFLLRGSTTILDEELLDESSSHFLSDLLQAQAGVSFDSFFGNSALASPQLRGFGENAQLRTLVTVDGLPINRSDLALTPWSQAPLSNLEEVTVLRGGRSVRYGSGAVAGVIALKTKRSEEAFEGFLEGSAGSDETFRQRLSLRGTSSGWGWTTQLENFVSDGYRENSAQASTSASVSLLTPEANWGKNRIVVSASRSEFEDPGPLSLGAFLVDPRQSLQADQMLETETLSLSNQLEFALGSEWRMEISGAGIGTSRSSDYQGRLSEGDSQNWNGELVVTRAGEEWGFEAGVRYQWSQLDFERSQPLGSGVDRQLAELQRATWGGFLTSRWKLENGLTLAAGASWDHYRLDGEAMSPNDAANPRRSFTGTTDENDYALEFGFEYQLTEGAKVWGRYDRSLRFPVLDEVAFFQGFESDIPFNTGLRPELGQGVELGVVFGDETDWKTRATLFGQWMEDEIFFDAFSNVNENLGETERLGFELAMNWKRNCWSVDLFYAAILARFQSGVDEGQRVPLVPRHALSGTLTWQLAENFDLGIEGSYLSERVDGNDRGELGQVIQFGTVPARTIWNASARWEVSDSLSVFCRVTNLFDEEYISTQFSDGIFPGAGRQMLVGGRVEF